MVKSSTSDLTTFSSNPSAPPRLDLATVLACGFGHCPWDDWERWALARGLAPELAGLGRLLIREACQHDWPDELKALGGWGDDGRALLQLGLDTPTSARHVWAILLRTDGLRGDVLPRSKGWTCGFLRADARRLQKWLFVPAVGYAKPESPATDHPTTTAHAPHS